MKRIYFLQLLLVVALAVHAQPTKIFVWLATGEQVTYNLADRPKMVVKDDNVHLTTKTADIIYAAKDIKKVTFDGEPMVLNKQQRQVKLEKLRLRRSL